MRTQTKVSLQKINAKVQKQYSAYKMYDKIEKGIPNSTFVSFNCKSVKRNIDFVRTLCQSADIVALQETWLLPHDISLLGTIDQDFAYTGKSAVDTSAGMLRGRPYGGLAILWRKSVFRS
ncbi:reverse transcriptase, partial [Operophtera brumata]